MKALGIIIAGMLIWQSCSDEDTGSQVDISEITPAEDFTDVRDGKIYKCIRIGEQIWMAENLNYYLPKGAIEGCYTFLEDTISLEAVEVEIDEVKFADTVRLAIAEGLITDPPGLPLMSRPTFILRGYLGMVPAEMIIDMMTNFPEIKALLESYYDGLYEEGLLLQEEKIIMVARKHYEAAELINGGYSNRYGLLYSYDGAQQAVPEGWKLPTDEDWKKLEKYLGMATQELELLNCWRGEGIGQLLGSTEEGIGFNALYGGCDAYSPAVGTNYVKEKEGAYFWTSSLVRESDSTQLGIVRSLALFDSGIMRMTTRLKSASIPTAYSVRCIKKENE